MRKILTHAKEMGMFKPTGQAKTPTVNAYRLLYLTKDFTYDKP